ncbi:hypothetical protein KR054_005070, partial [Drosophila jambulina]
WRFSASQELLRDFYLLQVEGRFKDFYCIARCYVKVEMGPVAALISGARQRKFSYREILWMNGSLSSDFSKRPTERQFSRYHWDCESQDDKDNRFCRRNISSEATFGIPAYSLKKGCMYVFQLQVFRDQNPKISSQISQYVTIIARRVLQVKIECLKNCKRDFFTPNSPILLGAVCLNCGRQNAARRWFIDDQRMFSTKEITIHIRAETNRTKIKLSMLSEDGRYGRDVKTLVRNSGPTGGQCWVSPQEGQEAITNFVPCCQRFFSENQPLEYWYFAGPVLLDSCLDCSCGIRLPATKLLHILVCDALFFCHSSRIKVKVNPLVGIPTQPKALKQYMNSSGTSIVKLLEEGRVSSYLQTINAIASRISRADSGITLLHGFQDIQPHTRSSLSKLANITLTLGHRLPTNSPKTQNLLMMLVRKLTDNIQELISNEDVTDMTQRSFIGTALACQNVHRLMRKIAEHIPRPPPSIYNQYHQALLKETLNQDLVDKLYLKMPTARALQWKWLNFTWETDRLRRFMSKFRARDGSFKAEPVPSKVDMEVTCLNRPPTSTLIVHTNDSVHTVYLTPALFKEVLGDTNVCYKLISIQRTLNWWYPDEKRPSSRILSVRIFKNKDEFKYELNLERSELSYIANITKSPKSQPKNESRHLGGVPARRKFRAGRYINVIRHGKLNTPQSVRLYRIVLQEQTVLAVHFTKSTHKMQVKMKLGVKPLWREISESKCSVPASTGNMTTLLIRNNCRKPKRAYLALRAWSKVPIRDSRPTPLPDGPALYTFAFEIRSCTTWIYSRPQDIQGWTQVGCSPTMEVSVTEGLHCTCSVLGTYTSDVYYIPPIRVSVGNFMKPTMNMKICALYLVVIIFLPLSMYFLFRYANDLPIKTIFIRMADDDNVQDGELHDILIKFHTGGRVNSETSASIILVLRTIDGQQRRVTVQQDPERSFFKRNSTFNVWLRSREIRVPTTLMIKHNKAGRYPSWFLRRIDINDIQTNETQIFNVRAWISDRLLILNSPHVHHSGEVFSRETWSRRFRLNFEMLCVNWALWQPVTGNWRENNMFQSISRAKRYCVFVTKLITAYTCVAIYFKPTSIESLQLDREMFISPRALLVLVLLVTAIDALFQVLFKLIAKHVS